MEHKFYVEIYRDGRQVHVWSAVKGKVERVRREGSVRMEGPESGASERFKR